MTAGGGDLERSLGLLLSLDLAEIDVVNIRGAELGADIGGRRLERTQALEKFESLAQALDAEHGGALADDGCLGGILAREHHARESGRAREQGGRQRAPDAFDAAVEREFAEDQISPQARAIFQHVLCGENSKREWQIERR